MNESFDFVNIIKNVFKRWKIILLLSLTAAFVAGTLSCFMYRPQYSTKATIVVLEKEMYKWSGASNAKNTAGIFREIVSSKVLRDRVAKAAGLDSLPGEISCENITNTNMMVLSVTADTPKDAVVTISGILEHYNEFSESILSDQVLHVLESPTVPGSPQNPYNGLGVLLRAFGISALACTVILFLRFYFRDDIKNPAQVEKKLDAKLFGTVYREKKKRTGRTGGEILVNSPATGFGFTETFRKICTKFDYMMRSKGAKTVIVTSVTENEGKSTVSANLALSLAAQGRKVLVVDADLHRPSQSRIFRLEYKPEDMQIGDILSQSAPDPAKIVRSLKNPAENVYILGGSKAWRSATKLTAGDGFAALISLLSEYVDYIIIDTPPMYVAADAEDIIRASDAALLVVRRNCAKVRDINDCVDIFRASDCELLGCIMNDADKGFASQVSYGGGYYYRYGSKYGKYRAAGAYCGKGKRTR